MPKARTGGRVRAFAVARPGVSADPGMGAFMATQTAPVPFPMSDYAGRPDAYAVPPARPRPRVVWPWPVFFLGVIALVAVGVGRHRWRPTNGDRLRRDLNEMRRLVDRGPGEAGRAR